MRKQILLVLSTLTFAFGVLFVSVFRTANVKYDFNPVISGFKPSVFGEKDIEINYYLPYPGHVLPDSLLWPLKAFRDGLWLAINTNSTREAELKLLFADKRIGSALKLFEKGDFDNGFSVFTKAEKYLEEASFQEEANRAAGIDTTEFLTKLANASLKHYELSEKVFNHSPNEAKPSVINTQEYPKKVYERSRNALLEKGVEPPKNPFGWD